LFQNFGFSSKRNLFRNIGDTVDKAFYLLLTVTGTVLLTVGGAYAGNSSFPVDFIAAKGFENCTKLFITSPFLVLLLGTIFLGFGTIGAYKDQAKQNERMDGLEGKNKEFSETRAALNATQEELQSSNSKILVLHEELVTTWLKSLFKHFNFNNNARITIYYEHDEEFYLLARYSKNPTYAKVHRQKFPLNQGVISKAWENETHIEDSCPISSNYEDYCNYLQQIYGYERDKIDSLTMKSCRYYARAIVDADDNIGVIVFESTTGAFLSKSVLTDIESYCITHQSQLSKFVRDSLSFDREINIKREGKQIPVEVEIMRELDEILKGVSV
jgi:hypothetical protein